MADAGGVYQSGVAAKLWGMSGPDGVAMRTKSEKLSDRLKARWAAGDPTLVPPATPIAWDAGLDDALRALVSATPAPSWPAVTDAMGISVGPCQKRLVALGLAKPDAPNLGRRKRERGT